MRRPTICSRSARLLLVVGLFGSGCLSRGSAAPDTGPETIPPEDNPVFTLLDRRCEVDDGEWVIDAETANWAGGITSWWTIDGSVVERHRIAVVESSPTGEWDRLRGVLGIVRDWREVRPGSSTSFLCAQEVSTVFWLENPLGARVQCQTRGPNPELFESIDGAPACPN